MHSLDVIIMKNARAAGREAAHAHNDNTEAGDIIVRGASYAQQEEPRSTDRAFTAGWNAGKQEG